MFNGNYYALVTTLIETDTNTPDQSGVERSLGDVSKRVLKTEENMLKRFKACVNALQKLHSHLVIHRDPRPPNFLYNQVKDTATILDFGFSVILDTYEDNKDLFTKDLNLLHAEFAKK
jgi:serine/threonine protein kinase